MANLKMQTVLCLCLARLSTARTNSDEMSLEATVAALMCILLSAGFCCYGLMRYVQHCAGRHSRNCLRREHPLITMKVPPPRCDNCWKHSESFALFYHCEQCDVFLCKRCVPALSRQAARARTAGKHHANPVLLGSETAPGKEHDKKGGTKLAEQRSAADHDDFAQVRSSFALEFKIDFAHALSEIQGGKDINSKDESGRTVLHHATEEGDAEVVRTLLSWRANVDEENAKGDAPLHTAAANNQVAVAGLLLEAGAERNKRNSIGYTPVAIAEEWGVSSTLQFLQSKGCQSHFTAECLRSSSVTPAVEHL